MKTSEYLAIRVAELRRARGLTQAELAARLTEVLGEPFATVTVTRIEKAKRPTNVDEVTAIGEILGVDPLTLIATEPIDRALKTMKRVGLQTLKDLRRKIAETDELQQMADDQGELIAALETVENFVTNGSPAGVREAITVIAEARLTPEFSEVATLREIALQLLGSLSANEQEKFATMHESETTDLVALDTIGRIIAERGDAEA